MHSNLAQFHVVQAGQHRHRQYDEIGLTGRSLNRCTQHLSAAGGVHRQHAHAELSRLTDSRPGCVWDVVVLEVEENAVSRTHQFTDDGWPFGGVELHADFIGEGGVADGRHDLSGGRGRRYIQGNYETLARIHFSNSLFRARCRVYRV